MSYHIEIATERRTPQATPMGLNTARLAHTDGGVLWCCSDEPMQGKDWSDPQFINVAEWDLKSPFVILHKGTYTPRFAGWPELTQEEYDALPALAPI